MNNEFMSLGFKETIVVDGKPEDKNLFIVSIDGNYELCEGTTLQINDKQIVFDTRERVLISVKERWGKGNLIEFIFFRLHFLHLHFPPL